MTKVIFSSDPTHQCCQNIKRTKNFAVCIPENASDPIIEKCGSVSSPSTDKFSMFNIHGEKAKKIDVLIPTKIISAWLEFELIKIIQEGSVELYLGQVLAAFAR